MIYTTPHEIARMQRIVDYSYNDELKHYCEWVSDEGDTVHAENVNKGAHPIRAYKSHIFYDLFFMRRAIERIEKTGYLKDYFAKRQTIKSGQ